MNKNILLAIHCLAFNHEPYIRDCLEGFVVQKTDFKFVAIVHDDASTDKTADIIREYEAKYPEIIKPIYEIENQYSKRDGSLGKIMSAAIDATGAKYIAMCEGDDYWTDPYKLQKQVELLETHPQYTMCYTDYCTVDHHGNEIEWYNHKFYFNRSYSGDIFRELLQGNYILTLTILYRKDLLRKEKLASSSIDYSLFMNLALLGPCAFLNKKTSCYRIHNCSITQTDPSFVGEASLYAWLDFAHIYLSNKQYQRHSVEHSRICGTITARIISMLRTGGDHSYLAKKFLHQHPMVKKYLLLGLFYRLRHTIIKHL